MPWFKGILREGYIDCLNNIHRFLEPYRNIAPVIYDWAQRHQVNTLLDIGSGGGMQIATLLQYQETTPEQPLRFVLSDLYPQVANYEHLKNQHEANVIDYIASPVPIRHLPQSYRYLSIFSAFHHFHPKDAAGLLNEVVMNRNGFCIVEFTERNWINLFSMIPAFFLNLLAPLTAPKFRWSKVLLGTVFPLIPLLVCFDGLVSVLRSYKVEELLDMIPSEAKNNFVIEYGSVPWGRLPLSRANYFFLAKKQTALS
ncbi:MAG: hypothetical protein Kow0060_09560 [Methylohalobius crimeensis]